MVIEQQNRSDSIPAVAEREGNWLLMHQDSVSEPVYSVSVSQQLYEGIPLPVNPLHTDWITGLLLLSAILFIIVSYFSKSLFKEIFRVLSFSPGGWQVADQRGIFNWQTTLANLASFINLSTFLYMFLIDSGIMLPGLPDGPLLWGSLLFAISLSVTLRHAATIVVGNISGKRTLFADYLASIYSLYRLIGIALIPIVISISYSHFSETETLINTGLAFIALVFIFRIIRLLFIFIRGNVSIFYFLLYLCALEILPCTILLKVLT